MINQNLFPDDALMNKFGFIVELDKLKSVFRRTLLLDKSRAENDAEHSWEMATMAPVLHSSGEPGTDLLRVLKMLLIHDLVEIDAGDTYVHDQNGIRHQAEREAAAPGHIIGLPAGLFGGDATPRLKNPDQFLGTLLPAMRGYAFSERWAIWLCSRVTPRRILPKSGTAFRSCFPVRRMVW